MQVVHKNYSISLYFFLIVIFSIIPSINYALPFNIIPKQTLPTTVTAGSFVTAYYSITNNTTSARNNNYIAYLPPNVTQISTGGDYENTCAAQFSLMPGSNCILQLKISGPVDASDPNPQHHLFACFPGGTVCAGTETPLNVRQIDAPFIAGGFYDLSTTGKRFPLLAVSINSGNSWTYSTDASKPALPEDYSDSGDFENTSCSGQNCLAAGEYEGAGGINFPLLAASHDGGITWDYKIDHDTPTLPSNYNNYGGFNQTSCSGKSCAAVGQYNDISGHSFPLLAASIDGGTTWTYKTNSVTSTVPAGGVNGSLNSVSCSEGNCVAVGRLSLNNLSYYPLAANSNDGGINWIYKIDTATPSLPSNYSDGGLNSISCFGQNCVAVGDYFDANHIEFPLIAVSHNGGTTWSYKINSSGPTLPSDYSDSGVLWSASCSGQNCIATGQYENNYCTFFPLLAVSHDSGTTWTYNITSNTPTLPSDYNNNGILKSASCSGQNCIAAGQYANNSFISFPLLATSQDGGTTRRYEIDSAIPNLPSDYSDLGNLASASCNGQNCVVAGEYSDSNETYFPLLAVSNDGGTTWTYKIDSNPSTLLNDFSSGLFNSTSTSLLHLFNNALRVKKN